MTRSEGEAKRSLKLSLRVLTRSIDLTEIAVIVAGIRIGKFRVVEQVIGLKAKLPHNPLCYGNVLEERGR